jgi:hypothetical protein
MFIVRNFFCRKKPLCGSDEEKEKCNGLVWHDVVLFEERKTFLEFESMFTYAEMKKFPYLEEGKQKEQLRQKIFNMRKQFLNFWCKTHNCRVDKCLIGITE